jgi:hypothetical protein
MAKPKVVAMSRWSKGGRGEHPMRYVVLDWGTGAAMRYSRHMQVDDGKTKPFFHGHYMGTFIDALQDAQKSVSEHSSTYKKANISHIPTWPNGEWIRIAEE